jgi:hypothetical protein
MSNWSITPVVTNDYDASIGELVQVDMSGKAAPDVVTIRLPVPTSANAGQSIAINTVNAGGAEDGSRVRLSSPVQIKPPCANICDSYGEVMQSVTSAGTYWVLTNNK